MINIIHHSLKKVNFKLKNVNHIKMQVYLILLHFALLCFIDTAFLFVYLKVCGNSVWSKSIGIIFPTAFAQFVFLCHVLVILTIFPTFKLFLCLLWWSVISVLWCYYCKKITTHWKLGWWLTFFTNQVFKN